MTIFKSSGVVPASLLAAGLALSACGDGGGGGASHQGPTGEPAVLPLPTRVTNAANKVKTSAETAKAAPDTITDKDEMLSPVDVMGDSSEAARRAMVILKARDDVAAELAKAKEALAELEKLKKEANEDQLIATIDAQIELAKRRIKDIEDIQAKGGKLANAVMKATKGKDETAAASAAARTAEVAKAVEDAATFQLGIASGKYLKQTGGKTPSSVTAFSLVPAGIPLKTGPISSALTYLNPNEFPDRDLRSFPGPVVKNDAPDTAKSFKDIFGDKVVKKGTSDGLLDVASFENMGALEQSARTFQLASFSHSYMGIDDGRIYCLAATCSVTDKKLGAGWYWAPPAGKEYALWKMEGEEYEEYTDYANYGYWLVMPTEGSKAGTITNVFIFGVPATATVGKMTTDSTLGNKATYTGEAIGISVLTDKGNAAKSGEFTADVTLTATFKATAAAARVEGEVTNFQGDAVDGKWEVTLEEAPLLRGRSTTLNTSNYGLTTAEGGFQPEDVDNTEAQGHWNARAYGGDAAKRPTGITGTFNALFTNGRVLGGYATRKED